MTFFDLMDSMTGMNALLEREVSRIVLLGRALEHALHSPDEWTASLGTETWPVEVHPDADGVTLSVDADPPLRHVDHITLCVRQEPLFVFPVDLSDRVRPFRVEFRLAIAPQQVVF